MVMCKEYLLLYRNKVFLLIDNDDNVKDFNLNMKIWT